MKDTVPSYTPAGWRPRGQDGRGYEEFRYSRGTRMLIYLVGASLTWGLVVLLLFWMFALR